MALMRTTCVLALLVVAAQASKDTLKDTLRHVWVAATLPWGWYWRA